MGEREGLRRQTGVCGGSWRLIGVVGGLEVLCLVGVFVGGVGLGVGALERV
jgi:hypothetical protein